MYPILASKSLLISPNQKKGTKIIINSQTSLKKNRESNATINITNFEEKQK